MMNENHRQELIEYAKHHLADLLPYDDINYEDELQRWAELYANEVMNHDFEDISKCQAEILDDELSF